MTMGWLDVRTRPIVEQAAVRLESDTPLTIFLAECRRDCNVTHPEHMRAMPPIRFSQPAAPKTGLS